MNMDSKTVLVDWFHGWRRPVGGSICPRPHPWPRSPERVVEQIRASGQSAVFLPADFSSLNEVRRLADAVRRETDRLDILINNAGIGSGGSGGKREARNTRAPSSPLLAHSGHTQLHRTCPLLPKADIGQPFHLRCRGASSPFHKARLYRYDAKSPHEAHYGWSDRLWLSKRKGTRTTAAR